MAISCTDTVDGCMPNFPTSLPTLHDNASPKAMAFFHGVFDQLFTLITANTGLLLMALGIYTVLLVVGFFADSVIRGRSDVKGMIDEGLF
jgi:hypothetical protein